MNAKKTGFILARATAALFAAVSCVRAQTARTWTGAAGTDWTDVANWQDDLPPGDGDDVLIPTSAARNPMIPAGVWPSPDGRYGSVEVQSGRTVTCLGDPTVTNEASGGGGAGDGKIHGIGVTLRCAEAWIAGTLTADQQGFPLSQGPGTDSKASYGGGPLAYGNVREPTALGSSTASARGGGAIAIQATGTITLNGSITANGHMTTGNRPSSGGSVWLLCQTLAGGGQIEARGGGGNSAWVAYGGRISLDYQERTYSGTVDAGVSGYWTISQTGAKIGQPGSLWEPKRAFPRDGGTVAMNEGSYQFYFPDGAGVYAWDELVIDGRWIELRGDAAVAVRSLAVTNNGVFHLDEAATSLGPGNVRLHGSRVACLYLPAGDFLLDTVTVHANGRIMALGDRAAVNPPSGGTPSEPHGAGLNLRCAALVIASNGTIDVSLLGFSGQSSGSGPGRAMGAGHGGKGMAASKTYGRLGQPTALGSGGHVTTAPGGGAATLFVDRLDLAAGGAILADGGSNASGCGAGGSIWIRAGVMTGGGALRARGGDDNDRYGGGGRIAVECGPGSTFSGAVDVRGGLNGTVAGGQTGSVFRATAAVPGVYGGWHASPLTLDTAFAVDSGPAGAAVTRSVTRWGPRTFAWSDAAGDANGGQLANEAAYTLRGLAAGQKAGVWVNDVFAGTLAADEQGALTITAVTLAPASSVRVEIPAGGTLLLLR